MSADTAGDATFRAGPHRLAVVTAACTLFLIVAGGLVTSTGSGLSVPDWPLSYGMLMPPMVGGIYYEHGHRMVASFVGLLTVALAAWVWRSESRAWVRRLGLLALLAVVLQGVLGGLTVLYLLPTPISVTHACLGQAFFCLTVTLALVTSRGWVHPPDPPDPPVDDGRPSLCALATATTAAIFIQLVLGALVRHTGSALAIHDFPLSFGRVIPSLSALTVDPSAPYPLSLETLRRQVTIQFVHRSWAVVVAGAAAWALARALRRFAHDGRLAGPAAAVVALIAVQVLLGGAVVWSQKAVPFATAHVAVGAAILGASLVLTLRCWHGKATRRPSAGYGRAPASLAGEPAG